MNATEADPDRPLYSIERLTLTLGNLEALLFVVKVRPGELVAIQPKYHEDGSGTIQLVCFFEINMHDAQIERTFQVCPNGMHFQPQADHWAKHARTIVLLDGHGFSIFEVHHEAN